VHVLLLGTRAQTLDLPHAYVNCIESSTPRLVFETVLNQLHRHVPTVSNAFEPYCKCSDLSSFIHLLSEAAFPPRSDSRTAPLSPSKGAPAKSSESLASPPLEDMAAAQRQLTERIQRANGSAWSAEETKYIIFDNAERLRALDNTLMPVCRR
jgi:hypothetical protein